MGWTSVRARQGASRLDMLASCSSFYVGSKWQTADGECLVEALKAGPGGVYGIIRKTLNASGDMLRFALVVLTEQKKGEFAYKSLSEFEGPVESRYPLAFLGRLSTPEELAGDNETRLTSIREWRQRVQAESGRTSRWQSIQEGVYLSFATPIEFRIDGQAIRVCRFRVREWGRRKRLEALPDSGDSFGCKLRRDTWASREYEVSAA